MYFPRNKNNCGPNFYYREILPKVDTQENFELFDVIHWDSRRKKKLSKSRTELNEVKSKSLESLI